MVRKIIQLGETTAFTGCVSRERTVGKGRVADVENAPAIERGRIVGDRAARQGSMSRILDISLPVNIFHAGRVVQARTNTAVFPEIVEIGHFNMPPWPLEFRRRWRHRHSTCLPPSCR